ARSTLTKKPIQYFSAKLTLSRLNNAEYIPNWQMWDTGVNRAVQINHNYQWKHGKKSGNYELFFETTINGSDTHYSQFTFTTVNQFSMVMPFELRVFGGWQSENIPSQNSFRLNGASYFSAAHTSWLYNSIGSLPISLTDHGHFQVPGGGNIRSKISTTPILNWLTALNLQTDPSELLGSLAIYSKVNQYLKIQPKLFLGWAVYEKEAGDIDSVIEFGGGVIRPLKKIPPALGTYVLRFDAAVPVWGKNVESNWVISLHREF
ncbi:MAG: hypothetical protein ACE5D7_09725, partial [Fidelibacterota bacterium]